MENTKNEILIENNLSNFIDVSITEEERIMLFDTVMNTLKGSKFRALCDIPITLLDIDTSYQTGYRTNRRLGKLIQWWNEAKLEPITVVPHCEEHKFYVVNGFGRVVASQFQSPKYKYLSAIVLLEAPEDFEERRKYEADLFAYQDRETSQLTHLQLHGAKLILKIEEVSLMEKMRKKYRFSYSNTRGSKERGVLGSYTETLALAKLGESCFKFVFDILTKAGYDRQKNGYSTYLMRSLRDMWKLYSDDRGEIKKFLTKYLRQNTPLQIKARSITKYPLLDHRTACSMYIEDVLVKNLDLKQQREFKENKVRFIQQDAV